MSLIAIFRGLADDLKTLIRQEGMLLRDEVKLEFSKAGLWQVSLDSIF
jgi:hypothetical protein